MHELAGIGGVVAALSVTSDLTRGRPAGEAMRACLLATELARRAGLDQVRQGGVHYETLLRFVGCAATSHEIAAALGSDDSRRQLPAGPTPSGDRLDAPGRNGAMHHGGQGGKRA